MVAGGPSSTPRGGPSSGHEPRRYSLPLSMRCADLAGSGLVVDRKAHPCSGSVPPPKRQPVVTPSGCWWPPALPLPSTGAPPPFDIQKGSGKLKQVYTCQTYSTLFDQLLQRSTTPGYLYRTMIRGILLKLHDQLLNVSSVYRHVMVIDHHFRKPQLAVQRSWRQEDP
jgi:hypothetical protein